MKIGLDWGGTKLEAIALDPETNKELVKNRIDSPKDDYQKIIDARQSKYLVGVATDYAEEYPDAPYIWKLNKLNLIEEIGNSNIEKYSINFELSK